MIDYDFQSYYFTLKIDSIKKMMDSSIIHSLIIGDPNYQNVEFYKFPPFNKFIENLVKSPINLDQTQMSLHNDSYYYSEDDSTYIYQIYYIKGAAYRIEVKTIV